MSLTPSTSDLPPSDINLTVHNYVRNSPVLSRATQDKVLSQGWRLAQNALSTSAGWRNAKMTCIFEQKISVFFSVRPNLENIYKNIPKDAAVKHKN